MTTTTTFVTAYAKIRNDNVDYEKNKNTEWRFTHFRELAKTGVNICLYGSENTFHLLEELENEFPNNVKLMHLKWENTYIYKMCEEHFNDETLLPEVINQEKDTTKYMTLMNSKIEFVNDAIIQNPFNTENFAWIDFSVFYLFSDKIHCSNVLKQLSKVILPEREHVYIPGCWHMFTNSVMMLNEVNWRFSGSFFMGTTNALKQFYELQIKEMKNLLINHKKLIWEVNVWALMEFNENNNIIWYSGNHNDTLLNIPFFIN